ncbi:MAG: 6-pyruvoyl-tetrahydropterin synthase-related protein [Thermoanaerobaculia bacterium]
MPRRRTVSGARTFRAGVLVALSGAAPTLAGQITLEQTTACSAVEGYCEVEIANRGDDAAHELGVELIVGERRRTLPGPPSLQPGATWRRRVDLHPEDAPPGRAPVTVRVRYHDEGGYPLSSLSYAYLEGPESPPRGLSATLTSIGVRRDPAVASLRIEPPARPGPVSVRIVLPDELTLHGAPVRRITHAGDTPVEIELPIASESAFAGSSYEILALLETEVRGVRDSLFVPATASVLPPRRPTDRFRIPLLFLLGSLVVALAIGTLRGEKGSPPWAMAAPAQGRGGRLLDLVVIGVLVVYLLAYLRPSLLLLPTTATGGDTASHYLTAKVLAEALLPQGRILGWLQGNLAGYPIFQLYFPLPFLLMAGLEPFVGLPVAFKLVTVLGVFLTPLAAYGAFRCFGFRRPAPALAAVLTVPFLLNETNSVWGGNLASTLAGEFSYSLGLALALLFAGTAYRGMVRQRHLVANAVLLAAVGLSHAYALLVAGALASAHLLWLPRLRANVGYLARLYALAFCLIGFWIVPLLAYAPYGSPYRDIWRIDSWQNVLPPILWPFAAVAALGLVLALARSPRRPVGPGGPFSPRALALVNPLWIGLVLYLVAPKLGGVDIRFLPLVQLAVALLAAAALAAVGRRVAPTGAAVLLLAGGTLLWSDRHVAYVPQWIEWNYSGFERKPLWDVFEDVNTYLSGGPGDPRVVFEHSPAHNAAGSIRAFESLPLFSGRSTLEGLYNQSGISAPEIFYLQSEYSQVASCPFPDYHCGRLDLERAASHLRQYNAGQLIARSEALKAALRRSDDFTLEAAFPPYEIHRVREGDGRYVIPLDHQPVLLTSEDWKRDFFRWFKRPGSEDVVLVRGPLPAGETAARFPLRLSELPHDVPRVPLAGASRVVVDEEIEGDRIGIRTSSPGHPLLIRISYHPRWRVRGAERVYLASPGFMLVIPEAEEIALEFGSPPIVRLGRLLTALGGILVVWVAGLSLWRRLASRHRRAHAGRSREGIDDGAILSPRRAAAGTALALLLCLGAWATAGFGGRAYAPALYERGLEAYRQERFADARLLFERAVAANPLSSAALHASFYQALAAYREERLREAIDLFTEMIDRFPESPYRAEAEYHVGLCHSRLGDLASARASFRDVVASFPDTSWSGYAAERLSELRPATLDEASPPAESGSGYDREPHGN